MFLHIEEVIKLSYLEYGFLRRRSSEGGSVAKARDAKLSIIKLIHNICTAFNGDSLITQAPRNAITSATKLIVSWN